MLKGKRAHSSKKGQVMILGIMLAVMAFLCALIFIPALKQGIDTARDPSHLDCTNSSISIGTSGTCIAVDFFLPFFIGAVLLAGISYIGAQLIRGG